MLRSVYAEKVCEPYSRKEDLKFAGSWVPHVIMRNPDGVLTRLREAGYRPKVRGYSRRQCAILDKFFFAHSELREIQPSKLNIKNKISK